MRLLIKNMIAGCLVGLFGIMNASFAAEQFVIATEGEPKCVIVVDPEAPEKNLEAARELNHWVQRISGVTLPVITSDQWDQETPYIAIGRSPMTEANGWHHGPLAQEEARVVIESRRIGLLGDDEEPIPNVERRGSYFAVLEFVRKRLGVRWIWPGPLGEVYTPQKTLAIAEGEWTWKPDILFIRSIRNGYRLMRSRIRMEEVMEKLSLPRSEWDEMAELHDEWLARQRMNSSRMRTFGHAFSKWWDLYGESHPDWFALPPPGVPLTGSKNSKLNLSNPEVQDKIFNDWLAKWKGSPAENRYLNLCPNDGRGFDTRPETRAWDAPELAAYSAEEIYGGAEPVLSDRHIRFVNLLARRVREIDPLAYVTTYAYRNYQSPPLTSIHVEPNVMIEYCGGEGYYPSERHIIDEWKEWSRRGALLCWRPNFLQTGHPGPYLFSRQIYDDLQTLRKHSLHGTDFDSLWGNWAGQGLIYYLMAELHSRPSASYEELAGEYFTAFGPASEAIKSYHEYFEEVTQKGPNLMREHGLVSRQTWGGWWEAQIRVIPLLFTAEVMAKGAELIAEAERKAIEGTEQERQRVAVVAEGFRHSALMAKTFRKLRLHDPKVQVRDGGHRAILKPLWDFRRKELVGIGQSYLTLFMEEQRTLGLWTEYFEGSLDDSGQVIRLAEGWRARPDASDAGRKEEWFQKEMEEGWTPIAVAQPWLRTLPGETQVVWYQIDFPVPDLADTGERVALRFEAIDSEAEFWINGEPAGERKATAERRQPIWQESFELEVTERVRSGAINRLDVRVASPSRNGGITGPVSMILRK